MSDLDLDLELLRDWEPASPPSAEVRAHARSRLEQQYVPSTRPRTARGFGRRFAIAAVVATVLVALAIFGIQRAVDDRVAQVKTVAVPKDVLGGGEIGKEPVNILVVGSDARDGSNPQAFGTPAETGPPRSDTMFVLRIDGSSVQALWIPRDLVVGPPPGQQINSTFNHGPQGLIDAVRTQLGITVDHFVEIDFRGFVKAVDALGGVTVYAPGQVRDAYSGLSLIGPGCRTLDGKAALAWVRSRHLEVLEGSEWKDANPHGDLDRIEREQEFFRSFGLRAKAKIGDDPTAAVDLVDSIVPALTVDSRLGKAEILGLVRIVFDMDPNALQSATIPVTPSADGAHLELDQPAAAQAVDAFLAGKQPPRADGTGLPTTTIAPSPTPTLPPPACPEG
jgi:LCP family protein required for cell wall assembly